MSLQPKRHLDRFSPFCTDDYRVSRTSQWDAPFLKIAPSHGDLHPHLTHGSTGQPESSTQTASRSVQPFLRGSGLAIVTDRQIDRPSDKPRYSVGNNTAHLRT